MLILPERVSIAGYELEVVVSRLERNYLVNMPAKQVVISSAVPSHERIAVLYRALKRARRTCCRMVPVVGLVE